VVEPSCAVQRIQRWLKWKRHGARVLERMRLVHCCSNRAAEAVDREPSPIGCV
jgi:hypothetical protein